MNINRTLTKFDELLDIISRNKNRNKKAKQSANNNEDDNDNDELIEVAGSEGSKNPIITFDDSESDPDLLDQLHKNPRIKPNQGYGADRWDD